MKEGRRTGVGTCAWPAGSGGLLSTPMPLSRNEIRARAIAFARDWSDATLDFDLRDLPRHIRAFGFIAGYETRRVDPEDPANLRAVELLGNLHDQLEEGGYSGHDLERFLVRILFCLFADDTGIFGDPDVFRFFIEKRTAPDGSDLGPQLARFFHVLNTPRDKRQKNLDEDLAQLPYVNGQLFSEHLGFAEFNMPMRNALAACCAFKWNRISPHIFGALFQSVMQPKERRQIGAHYTSERDILKLIRSLFLDDLQARFEKARNDKAALRKLHDHIAALKFLDPACGCGNFLILAYRELRRLEIAILKALYGEEIPEGDLRAECRVDVDQMHGIEIEEWPARIAEVAMWLTPAPPSGQSSCRHARLQQCGWRKRHVDLVGRPVRRLDGPPIPRARGLPE